MKYSYIFKLKISHEGKLYDDTDGQEDDVDDQQPRAVQSAVRNMDSFYPSMVLAQGIWPSHAWAIFRVIRNKKFYNA